MSVAGAGVCSWNHFVVPLGGSPGDGFPVSLASPVGARICFHVRCVLHNLRRFK